MAYSGGVAHKAAEFSGGELGSWNPEAMSGDSAWLPEMETIRGRTDDMARNNGLLSGGFQIHLDNIIGPELKLSAKPDWRALGQTAEWAREWQRETESKFNCWAYDVDNYIDTTERFNLAGLVSQAYRSYLQNYEILAVQDWIPGRAKYSTAIQVVDVNRLSNPNGEGDRDRLRGGVALSVRGAPTGYWIASNMAGDPMRWDGRRRWRRVPKRTRFGRQLVAHIFDPDKPGQTRGRHGLVSILSKMKMLEKFEESTLQAAILNAMYAAVIESSYDWSSVADAMGAGPVPGAEGDPLETYIQGKSAFHKNGAIRYNGVKIPHLFPGEKLSMVQPQHPSAAFAAFEEATIRHLASGLNISYEQLSRDYSKTNYSGARAGLAESHKFFSGKRVTIAGRFATWVYSLWLEEAIDKGDVETPAGAPSFYEMKTAWCRARWIGPAKGHIDPLKEKNATKLDFEMNLTTLENEAAERGEDWEALLEQRAMEVKRTKEIAEAHGLDPDELRFSTEQAPMNTVEVDQQ